MMVVVGQPSISVSRWPVLARCSRRLALSVDPDRRVRGAPEELRFRLGRAVEDAVREAHLLAADQGLELEAVLAREPAAAEAALLEAEELAVFARAMDAYLEACGGEGGVLDLDRSGVDASRPSACGRYRLTARPGLVLRSPDGLLEVRRIVLSAGPGAGADVAGLTARAAALAVAMRAPLPFRLSQVWVLPPVEVATVSVDDGDVAAFVASLRAGVDAVLDAGDETPSAGWWCSSCECIGGCPAVPQAQASTLLARLRT
jgi:hypothetical protein